MACGMITFEAAVDGEQLLKRPFHLYLLSFRNRFTNDLINLDRLAVCSAPLTCILILYPCHLLLSNTRAKRLLEMNMSLSRHYPSSDTQWHRNISNTIKCYPWHHKFLQCTPSGGINLPMRRTATAAMDALQRVGLPREGYLGHSCGTKMQLHMENAKLSSSRELARCLQRSQQSMEKRRLGSSLIRRPNPRSRERSPTSGVRLKRE